MKRHGEHLQRLFEAARAARNEMSEVVPSGLKKRILSRWQGRIESEEACRPLPLWLRRALFCAGVVMVLSMIWSAQELMSGPPSDVAIANYELRSVLMP